MTVAAALAAALAGASDKIRWFPKRTWKIVTGTIRVDWTGSTNHTGNGTFSRMSARNRAYYNVYPLGENKPL